MNLRHLRSLSDDFYADPEAQPLPDSIRREQRFSFLDCERKARPVAEGEAVVSSCALAERSRQSPAWRGREGFEDQTERFEIATRSSPASPCDPAAFWTTSVQLTVDMTAPSEHRLHRPGARLALQVREKGGCIEHHVLTESSSRRALLAALRDQFVSEAPALEPSENRRMQPALDRLRLLDHEVSILYSGHEGLAGPEPERLSNRGRHHEPPLGAEPERRHGSCRV